jgi:hypothetical protein
MSFEKMSSKDATAKYSIESPTLEDVKKGLFVIKDGTQ